MQTHDYAWKIEENKNLRNQNAIINKLVVCIKIILPSFTSLSLRVVPYHCRIRIAVLTCHS